MIRHICMFKLEAENMEEKLQEALKRGERLREIPEIRRLELVGNSKAAPESNYEFSLIADFDSIDDLNQYQKNPIHLEFGKYISSVRTDRACIDYEF